MQDPTEEVRGRTILDGQTLATFGAASVDDCTATASLHADQEAMGTGTAGLGGLVSTFHFSILENSARFTLNAFQGNPRLSPIFCMSSSIDPPPSTHFFPASTRHRALTEGAVM
jgi:hypothetical protein